MLIFGYWVKTISAGCRFAAAAGNKSIVPCRTTDTGRILSHECPLRGGVNKYLYSTHSVRFVKKTLGGSPTGERVEAPQALTCNTNTNRPPGAQIDGDSGVKKNQLEGWTLQPPGKSDPEYSYEVFGTSLRPIFLRFGKFPLQICESCGVTYGRSTKRLVRCKVHPAHPFTSNRRRKERQNRSVIADAMLHQTGKEWAKMRSGISRSIVAPSDAAEKNCNITAQLQSIACIKPQRRFGKLTAWLCAHKLVHSEPILDYLYELWQSALYSDVRKNCAHVHSGP